MFPHPYTIRADIAALWTKALVVAADPTTVWPVRGHATSVCLLIAAEVARRLRRHLKLAKVERIELHKDFDADTDGTGGSRRADFDSFRRLFCTSLAMAGVNIQQAMELVGHRRADTAMRYVKLAKWMMSAPATSRPRRPGADTASGPKPPADTAFSGGVAKTTGLLTKRSGGFRVVEPSGIEPLTS